MKHKKYGNCFNNKGCRNSVLDDMIHIKQLFDGDGFRMKIYFGLYMFFLYND